MHAGHLTVVLEVGCSGLAVHVNITEWGLAITDFLGYPEILVGYYNFAVNVGSRTIGIVAHEILVYLSDDLPGIIVRALIAKPKFKSRSVLVIVHLLQGLCRNSNGVFKALRQFVLMVLVRNAVQVVKCSLGNPGWNETAEPKPPALILAHYCKYYHAALPTREGALGQTQQLLRPPEAVY